MARAEAMQGHADAQYELGWRYAEGEDLKKDNEEAVRWFREAAAQGHEAAQKELRKLKNFYHMDKAISGCGALLAPGIHGWNPCLVLVVVAFNYIHAAMCSEGLKIDVLAFNRCGIVRICLCSGDEVLDGY